MRLIGGMNGDRRLSFQDERVSERLHFKGRVGLQQRVLPQYRVPFLELLGTSCPGGLSVFAGEPEPQEGIQPATGLAQAEHVLTRNKYLFSPENFLLRQKKILEWLQNWDPQALILEANPRYLSNWRAQQWMKKRGRPVLVWGLGAQPAAGLSGRIRQLIRSGYLRDVDGILAYSTRGAAMYARTGFPAERIFVAHNAVDPAPAELTARPLPTGPLRIIFVGRLQPRKRIDLLLQACRDLPQKPQVWIVGEGPARQELESLATKIYPQAVFYGGVYGQDLQALLDQADLFVLPGTGGLAVQQAMGRGLPVIVAAGDGTQADLVRPQNGWLIPADNLTALRQTLLTALSDPRQLRAMGVASHRIVSTEINIEAMVNVFHQALLQVTEGSG